jgi:ribulose-5-phosphate 4-epimerase/fuculose-1-phosphate aldolase
MHLAVYQAREDVQAIVHTHSPHATALACLLKPGCSIPPYTPGYAYSVRHLQFLPYYRPGSQALADAIRQDASLANGFLLQNHGVVALGGSLREALGIAEEIEDNCRLYLLTQGQARPLSAEEVEEIWRLMN